MGELKTIKLQGKDYVQVAERIRYFRENYKDGRIVTSQQILGDRVVFTANIYIGDSLVSTAHSAKNITAEFNLEKAETRSIGRALGIFGIGIDCGVSTYDEAREYFDAESDQEKLIVEFRILFNKATTNIKKETLDYAKIEYIPTASIDQLNSAIDYLRRNK